MVSNISSTSTKKVLTGEMLQSIRKCKREAINIYRMDEWCTNQHGSVSYLSILEEKGLELMSYFKTGLTQACLTSPNGLADIERRVLEFVKKWVPDARTGVLAGNSVHVDKTFLAECMPSLVEHLHYR